LFSRLFGVIAVLLTIMLGSRLYGGAVGWFAGLILVTNSTFVQFTATLRMESLLCCGILLALIACTGERPVLRPALFYGGVGIGLLAKGPAGLLPAALAPVLALCLRKPRTGLGWWIGASPIVLLPGAWFAYMLYLHGAAPVSDLAADTLRGVDRNLTDHLLSAFHTYVESPFRRYWPWLPFMLGGMWWAASDLFRSGRSRRRRARAALLLAWIGIVTGVGAWKPDHDIRYLYPALPAFAMLGAWALVRCFGRRVPHWALVTVLLSIVCTWPVALKPDLVFSDVRPAIARMRVFVDANSPAGEPLAVLGTQITGMSGPRRQSEHRDWIHFYLGRQARLYSVRALELERSRNRSFLRSKLEREPFLFVAKMPGREQLAADLGLKIIASTPTMLLAVRPEHYPRPGE